MHDCALWMPRLDLMNYGELDFWKLCKYWFHIQEQFFAIRTAVINIELHLVLKLLGADLVHDLHLVGKQSA